MKNWKKWFIKWINTGASIATIIALMVTVYIFYSQIELQRSQDFNEHLSNIKGLTNEIETDSTIMNNIIKGNWTGHVIYATLIMENMKRSVADGKISNSVLKNYIINILYFANEYNNVVEEEINLQSNAITQTDVKNQLLSSITSRYLSAFNEVLSKINEYESCLETKKDIITCNSASY